MIKKIKYKDKKDWKSIKNWLAQRNEPAGSDIESKVKDIIATVKEQGDSAVADYTRQFDCPLFKAEMLSVAPEKLDQALHEVPQTDLDLIAEAAKNIRAFHLRQKQNSWIETKEDGTILGQLVKPVQRTGLYVPGGQGGETPLISSLLMNAIPAQVAGVKDIIIASPPRQDGTLNPYILAAAKLLGLENIYCAGSAWAIAALALGTESIEGVDVIAGPGNIFVTTAKRLLMGHVGIDMIAGPSEIAILADDSADPAWLAADMLSQAEHDALASAILISTKKDTLEKTRACLAEQVKKLPRVDLAQNSLKEWGAIIEVPDMKTGIELVNLLAPEHFELCVSNPWDLVGKVENAGAIFMGHYTPEPVGDYFAGPNHVLPTLGNARFSSALSVDTFCKKSSLIATSSDYVQANIDKVARLARLEGLEAHARSMEVRKK